MALEPFALTRVESSRIARELARGATGRLSAHLAGPDEDAALLSLQVTGEVFLDAFGNTPEVLRAEYDPLLPAMTHVVVVDRVAQAPVGALILQEGRADRLKTLVDIAAPPWSIPVGESLAALHLAPDDRHAADLLALAVQRAFRNRAIAPLLTYSGWVVSAARGIDRWTAILDDGLLGGLGALTEGGIVPIGAARSAPYLGSPGSTPITVKMDPAEDADMLRCVQKVGRAVSRFATFCPRLAPDHEALQSWALPARSVA